MFMLLVVKGLTESEQINLEFQTQTTALNEIRTPGTMTIDGTFDTDLENPKSERYQQIERDTCQEVREIPADRGGHMSGGKRDTSR